MKKRANLIGLILGSFMIHNVMAAESVKLTEIEIKGNERISKESLLAYLPIQVGDHANEADSPMIIKALFDSGFFEDVHLHYQGSKLTVTIKERPIIQNLEFDGNRKIETSKLDELLKKADLVRGQVYSESLLQKVKTAIQEAYVEQGYYNASVNVQTTTLPHNLVALKIHIHEGALAKIKSIHILGNKKFKEGELLKQLSLHPTHLTSWFAQDDRYSKAKFLGDLEKLRAFYLDRGYLKFQITSHQVSLSPDHKGLYITIHVNEGVQYRINKIELTGEFIVGEEKIREHLAIKEGDIFARDAIIKSNNAITMYLGNQGYAFASVNVGTHLHEDTHNADLQLEIQPGKKIYVRRIGFSGNIKTNDEVLRRELLQPEGGIVSLSDIEESARRLRLLPYLKDIRVTTATIPGTDDQIDVGFTLTEVPSAKASVALGYSSDGILFELGFNQENFLGTGKNVGFDFSNDKFNRVLSIYYENPYYTINGVSRAFNVYAEKTTPGRVNLASYTTSQYGGSVSYGIPVAENSRINVGYGYDHTEISVGQVAARELRSFVEKYGSSFDQILLTAGWRYNSLNQANFPTSGLYQYLGAILSIPVSDKSLSYYKLNYKAAFYKPIAKDFTLILKGNLGYGDGYGDQAVLPFFKNYFAGGIGSVRGYESNTLGPRDSRNDPLGGNLLITGSAGVAVPQPFSEDLRPVLFIDAGNVFNTNSQDTINRHFAINQLRFSAGLEVEYRSMFGPLVFSLAAPFHMKEGDKKEVFQFTVGTSF